MDNKKRLTVQDLIRVKELLDKQPRREYTMANNSLFWQSDLSKYLGLSFTDDELIGATKHPEGYIGIRQGFKCYLTPIRILDKQPLK